MPQDLDPPVFAQQNYGQSYRVFFYRNSREGPQFLEEFFTYFKVGKLTYMKVALIRV
jgi:hypothetical protein